MLPCGELFFESAGCRAPHPTFVLPKVGKSIAPNKPAFGFPVLLAFIGTQELAISDHSDTLRLTR